jgi:hypothetical protein
LCLAGSTSAYAVTEAQISTASPFQFGDLTTFNWRILDQVQGTGVPSTPTGNQTGFIRMFSNGNTNNPVGTSAIVWTPDGPTNPGNPSPPNYPDTFNVDGFGGGGEPIGSSSLYYGLEFGNGANGALEDAVTVDTITSFVAGLSGLGAADPVSPIFAFDQNQEGSDPDIFLRGKLFLVDPSILPTDGTLSPAQVDAAIAGALSSQIRQFNFLDNGTSGLPPSVTELDDPLLSGDDNAWVLLPGEFDPDGPGTTFTEVDNNGAGNNADWGGFLLDGSNPLNLRDVLANDGLTAVGSNWLFIVEFQALADNNGKEEAYILGALMQPGGTNGGGTNGGDPNGAVPEPTTAALGLLACGALAMTMRRRS